ncbi:MAG TPA: NUDIX hydrolase [Candidatus Saccharimonadia bacterium]|jgi:ADP-ribose pyrophosphatase YjhB (NUDIX family)
MENPSNLNFAITCRGLIVDQGELLMCRQHTELNWFCLPGGKLDIGERLEDCMARELLEETGIRAEVGKLLVVNDWISPKHKVHRVEFLFWIRNPTDFRQANFHQASHGHELVELKFGDPTDPKFDLKPSYLIEKFPRIAKLGEDFPTELVVSES